MDRLIVKNIKSGKIIHVYAKNKKNVVFNTKQFNQMSLITKGFKMVDQIKIKNLGSNIKNTKVTDNSAREGADQRYQKSNKRLKTLTQILVRYRSLFPKKR